MVSLVELEQIASRGWRGTSTAPLGEWLLRAGAGFTGRANSVLPLGSPGMPFDDALEEVTRFYRSHDLPALFQVPFEAGAEPWLMEQLVSSGWEPFNPTSVMVAPLTTARAAYPSAGSFRVEHRSTPSVEWLTGYHYRGQPLPEAAVSVLLNADGLTFLSLYEQEQTAGPVSTDVVPDGKARGAPVGVARGVVTDDWLGITAVTVPAVLRRQGVGSAVMSALVEWGGANGAHHLYLQVDTANDAAIAMYRRGGFVEHHRYVYLRRP